MGFITLRKVALVLLAALLVAPSFSFLMPTAVHAADAKWINRFTVFYNGQEYVDSDTFDDNYEFIAPRTDTRCPTGSTIRFNVAGQAFYHDNTYFYYNFGAENAVANKAEQTTFTYVETTAGGTGCKADEINIDVKETPNRRITFYYNSDTDTIHHIQRGIVFRKMLDKANVGIYVRNDDTDDYCKDIIVRRTADPRKDDFFNPGGGDVPGSNILYAVRDQTYDADPPGKESETYNDLIDNMPAYCKINYNDVELGGYRLVPSGVTNSGQGHDDNTRNFMLAAGMNALGFNVTNDNNRNEDAWIIFVGDKSNVTSGQLSGTGPGTTSNQCDVPGLGSTTKDDPNCQPLKTSTCRVAENGDLLANSLSWILCPIASMLSGFMTFVEENLIRPYLTINPLVIDSPIYRLWDSVRTVANIGFGVVLLLIVFATATGFGMSNLGVKKALPLFFGGVIAANMSFFAFAGLVDVTNIFQQGIANLASSVIVQPDVVQGAYRDADGGDYMWMIGGALVATLLTGGAVLSWAFGFLLLMAAIVLAAVVALVVRYMLFVTYVAFSPLSILALAVPNLARLGKAGLIQPVKLAAMGPFIALAFITGKLIGAIFGGIDPSPTTPLSTTDQMIQIIIVALASIVPLGLIPVIILTFGGLAAATFKAVRKGSAPVQQGAQKGLEGLRGKALGKIASSKPLGASASTRAGRVMGRAITGTLFRPYGARKQAVLADSYMERAGKEKGLETLARLRSNPNRIQPNDLRNLRPTDMPSLSASTVEALLTSSNTQIREAMAALIDQARRSPEANGKMKVDVINTINELGSGINPRTKAPQAPVLVPPPGSPPGTPPSVPARWT